MSVTQHCRRSLYWRLFQQLRPYWVHLAGLLGLSLLAPPLALLTPLPLKIAVDNVIGRQPLPRFIAACLPEAWTHSEAMLLALVVFLVVTGTMLTQLHNFASTLLSTYGSEKLLREFRARMFRHVQRLSLAYHDAKGTSDSLYRIQTDAMAIQRIFAGIAPFVTATFTIASMVCVTAWINWRLALVAVIVAPVIFLASHNHRRRLRQQSRGAKALESSALRVMHEALGAARVVKAFGQEDRETERFIKRSNEGMQARLQLVRAARNFNLLAAFIVSLGIATLLFIGLRDIKAGTMTLGDLVLVMGYASQLQGPLKSLSKRAGATQLLLASVERAFALLDEAPDVVERPDARRLGRARGAMVFREVSFAYDKERPVLDSISFEIEPGTCLGLAGTSGAGKTTLVSLLTRFYDPTRGVIFLDGVDLREYSLADLRNQFALVLQEPVLFPTSIAENIAYARPGASEAEIIAAATAANAHDFIAQLSAGYETPVGDRGMKLSGGERQRISLARAFLKNAPILILDEPTSSVDVKTEGVIVKAMERLMQGRTTFIIAHRPSTLQHCHQILRIEAGRLVALESGPLRSGKAPSEEQRATAVLAGNHYV
ncbi:MAG TPA: ABC transporter ATP-binding protein [Verrucomicrobiae bacterium]|nr:ABC transporter ATP-binding protein [Verrucomicrobiae bacterium]